MNRTLLCCLALAATSTVAAEKEDRPALDACIKSWGKDSPFKSGSEPTSIIATNVKVFGVGGSGNVSDKAVSDYYTKNKSQFAQPEKRDLRVVVTKDSKHAQQAMSALNSGDSWKTVVNKYSVDDQTKASEGKLPAQPKGQLDKALDDAIFSAPKNKVSGPVKSQNGYIVFSVTGVTPPSQQSLDQAKTTIQQTLKQQNQQKALDAFVKDFTERWRDKTQCSSGYRTSDCKNGPKPTPTPTASAVATPAGG